MTEYKGDKRTKAYREWKAKHEQASEGLGDDIEKYITKPLGIKKAVKFLAGEDCGCDERKEKLNKLFPRQKPECFTASEYELVKDAIESKKNTFTAQEVKKYVAIYNRIFNQKFIATSCDVCFRNNVWDSLKKVYNQYN
jgi:hypothetical protein